MRIATWNMAYWTHSRRHDDAWRWVFDAISPDILLCQECVPPGWVRDQRHVLWHQAYPGSKQRWGTGIVTSLPCKPASVPGLDEWFASVPSSVAGETALAGIHKADQWLAAAAVEVPKIGTTLVVSVHSPAYPIEKSRLAGIDISRMKLKNNPDLWMTDVVFYFLRALLGSRMLVGGDLNSSRLLDKPSGAGGNNEFFDRIREEGFVSLHRRFHEVDERTYFKERKGPHQLDYLYADGPVAEHVSRCAVHSYDDVAEFGDHAPLVADFDFAG